MKQLLTKVIAAAFDKGVDMGAPYRNLTPSAAADEVIRNVRTAHTVELLKEQGFTEAMPTDVGLYDFASYEGDFTVERFAVGVDDQGMSAQCPHLGRTDLSEYHNGLTTPLWRVVL